MEGSVPYWTWGYRVSLRNNAHRILILQYCLTIISLYLVRTLNPELFHSVSVSRQEHFWPYRQSEPAFFEWNQRRRKLFLILRSLDNVVTYTFSEKNAILLCTMWHSDIFGSFVMSHDTWNMNVCWHDSIRSGCDLQHEILFEKHEDTCLFCGEIRHKARCPCKVTDMKDSSLMII